MNGKKSRPVGEWVAWARKRDLMKTQWVVAVVVFWITVAILAGVYFFTREAHFILLSIALGTMVLGVWLKARYQLHVRKEPAKSPPKSGAGGP